MALYIKEEDILCILNEQDTEEMPGHCIDGDEDSDVEEEVITRSDHESDSEQEYISTDVKEEIYQNDEDPLYHAGECKWSKTKLCKTAKVKRENIHYSEPKECAAGMIDEAAAFFKIIDIGMIDEIVKYTNAYINSKSVSVNYTRKRDARETNRSEIYALFGVLYLLGAKKARHTNVLELWATDGTGIQVLRAVMGSKRFLFLLRCLRFDDRSTRHERAQYDKLAPLRYILDCFVYNCVQNYNLGEYVTIDERIEPFRGKCGFVQHYPNKSVKYGLKIFTMCDSKTYYTSNIEIFCGEQPYGPYYRSNTPQEIVERLVSPITGTGRNLTIDNWFTSYSLVKVLNDKKITCLGALKRTHPEIPPEFQPRPSRAVGSSIFGYQKDMTLVSYVPEESKAIIVLSTMPGLGSGKDSTNIPDIISNYNLTKDAVNTLDQMSNAHSIARTTRKWTLAVFFSLLNIAGINAQILYQSNPENARESRPVFLKNLALSLMKPHLQERARIPSLPVDVCSFLAKYRQDKNYDCDDEPARKKRGRCVMCGRTRNMNTTIKCDWCKDFVCKSHVSTVHTCLKCEANNTS